MITIRIRYVQNTKIGSATLDACLEGDNEDIGDDDRKSLNSDEDENRDKRGHTYNTWSLRPKNYLCTLRS